MGNRGRPSSAALTIVHPAPIETVERQRPPHDLTDEEVEVWVGVVDNVPADWFSPATVPLLAQYCRHYIHARRIASMLERATSDKSLELVDYDRLLKMQERESRAIAALASKMRIAQQSTTNHRGNKAQAAARRPWQG